MRLAYRTVDVFTRTRFGGNQLAVVFDADDLDTCTMQALAGEFRYSETVFVTTPDDPRHTARLRIFTPATEVPFAGHPNVGAGFVIASREPAKAAATSFVFEQSAGLVEGRVTRRNGEVETVSIAAPEPLSIGTRFSCAEVAACLSLGETAVTAERHAPLIASLGLPFLVVEISDRAALRAARPDVARIAEILPCEGADALYLYTRDTDSRDGDAELSARMFAPWDDVPEDPATGSATGAACALITKTEGTRDAAAGESSRRFRVAQGVDMGRPSLLEVDVPADGGRIRIGGACVPVMSGVIEV